MTATHDGGAAEEAVEGRWRIAWHGFFYVLLAYATAAAISGVAPSAATVAAQMVPAVALAAWYWLWLLGPQRQAPHATRNYLVGAAILWAVLMAVDPAFLILAMAVFAPFCLRHVGIALVMTLLVVGGVVWQGLAGLEGASWSAVGGLGLLAIACSLLSVGTMGAVVRQSRQRKLLVDELRATRAELAATERQAGMLQERERLARDIHDTLTRGFASVVMLLEAAEESLATGRPVGGHIEQALRSARANLAESRRVVWALRPQPLTEHSLPDALKRLTGQLADETGIHAETVVTGTVRPLGADVEAALLRIAQEALANVRKHAAASEATVTISYLDDVVMLDVHDDGVGFDPAGAAATDGGLGMRAMRERTEALGGTLAVESAPREGTTVAAEVPLPHGEGATTPTGSMTS
jgi:signal transduction histidine kinase